MRRLPVFAAALGVLLLVGALAWRAFAVPALVRFPVDLDVSPRYEGAVTLFVDPDTFAPEESTRPLVVNRRIVTDGDESGNDRVVLDETLELEAADLFHSTRQHRYVMDRRRIVNVDDPRAWSFFPTNPVDRSGAYRLAFPLHLDPDATYVVFRNEIGDTYELRPDTRDPESKELGLTLRNVVAESDFRPVAPAYLDALSTAADLPASLPLDELEPVLRTRGIDISAVVPQLNPVLSADDRDLLLGLAAEPIELEYLDSFSGRDSVEPDTGSVVAVRYERETVAFRPAEEAAQQLDELLGRYPQVAGATEAKDALAALRTDPIPLFTNEFRQTDGSIAEVARDVRDQRDKVLLVERAVPLLLVVVGLVIGGLGVVGLVRGGRRARDEGPPEVEAEPEPESQPQP